MNKRAVLAIARKDIRAITANLQVWLPMAVLPMLLGVIIPTGVVISLRYGGDFGSNAKEIASWIEQMPVGGLRTTLETFPTLTHQMVYLAANYLLAPLFLLIPLMTASVIAADSFAGEKERGTMETLLFAPVDMLSLFTGKVLASFIPALALSLATFLLCGLTVNLAGWPLFRRPFFPHLNWLPLILLVIPMISLLAILLNVFISARVATFQAAYQLGGVVVLPVLALLAGQATGVVVMDTLFAIVAGVALAALDLLLLRKVLRHLNRNLLFASQVK